MNEPSSNNLPVIGGIIAVSVLLFGGLVWLLAKVPSDVPPLTTGPVSFADEGMPFIGPSEAKVTVQIYGDFQCPACKAAEPALKLVMDKYQDRVAFVWKDFPLMSIHPNARAAANAAWCAKAQGKFWEYHDELYAQQNAWSGLRSLDEAFAGYAKNVGMLDETVFRSCFQSRAHDDKVMAGVSEGTRNGVDRTPTYFINNERVFGMTPAEWYEKIDRALAAAGTVEPAPSTQATTTVPVVATSTSSTTP
jgi:protein-disulfide isomerase